MKKIRCSMLPSWVDCARRTAAKQYRQLIEDKGFKLRTLQPSVGAAIGTAVHHAVCILLKEKQKENFIQPVLNEAIKEAGKLFIEEIRSGAVWDDTSPNTQTAIRQIESLTLIYAPLIDTINPVLVEEPLAVALGPDWQLTGTVDLFDAKGALDDLKTGVLPRPYIQQAGGYVLLLDANGYKVTSAGITYVKRVRQGKPQPLPVHTDFALVTASRSAYATAQEIVVHMDMFEEDEDEYKIRANPMSLMCSKKYCPAWGTDFCTVHLKDPNE